MRALTRSASTGTGAIAESAAAPAGGHPDDMSLDAPPAPRPCRWGARIQP
jgi:hypothetical protein